MAFKRSFHSKRPRKAGRSVTVLHTCKHKVKHRIPGPRWKVAREVERLSGLKCVSCWSNAQAVEAETYCGLSPEDLPELKGTVRQIEWARSIRAQQVGRIMTEAMSFDQECKKRGMHAACDTISDLFLGKAVKFALRRVRAKWWIEHLDAGNPLHLFLKGRDLEKIEKLRKSVFEVSIITPTGVVGSGCPF